MQKVIVVGCPGSGKTVFSKKLHKLTGLPLVHLDFTYHRINRETANEFEWKKNWRAWVVEQVAKPQWIIDGNYKSTMDIRISAADTVIYLDYSRFTSLCRAFKRRLQYHGKTRSDMPEDWSEHINFDFLKFVWNYRKIERPKVLALLDQYREEKNIQIFRNSAEADSYLARLS